MAAGHSPLLDLATGLALVLVIEGTLWCLFPGAMRRATERILGVEPAIVRRVGLAVAAIGVALVWLIRR